VVFRTGVIDGYNHIHLDPPGKMLESPEHIRKHKYHRTSFVMKLDEMQVSHHLAYQSVTSELPEVFTYEELRKLVDKSRILLGSEEKENLLLNEIMWLASSHYDIEFSKETLISERVIFPIAETEVKGIEDARFVRFTEAEGMHTYYATYTAFDGNTILPKLLLTRDFRHFTLIPVNGEVAQNKGMALFPRMVNGKYAMLCRTDGVNNYIAYSDKINMWRYAKILQYPSYTWEFVQIGNCGSPIEIPEVLTPSRAKILRTSAPSSSSPIVPAIAVETPSLLRVTAATAAGPPPARAIWWAKTLSSSPGYLSTKAMVSIVITPRQTT
jgi:hypothetical protein